MKDRKKLFKRLKNKVLPALWSIRIRKRDGNRCIMCGKSSEEVALNAHHWIVPAGRSLRTRFILDNGVSLCYACHIFKVHKDGAAQHMDAIRLYMRRFVSEERYEEIKRMGNDPWQPTLEDFDRIKLELEERP